MKMNQKHILIAVAALAIGYMIGKRRPSAAAPAGKASEAAKGIQ